VASLDAAVFDLGGVLLDWDPRHPYREAGSYPASSSDDLAFTQSILEWALDLHARGRSTDEIVEQLAQRYPERSDELRRWRERYMDMVRGPIEESVVVLDALRPALRLFALSNWPREAATQLRVQYAFMTWFEGVVLSGEEGIRKPDPEIFRRLLSRYELDPTTSLYVDDEPDNVAIAADLGFCALLFESPTQLRMELTTLGFDLKH
jgi:2-haloacid dehalogenase